MFHSQGIKSLLSNSVKYLVKIFLLAVAIFCFART